MGLGVGELAKDLLLVSPHEAKSPESDSTQRTTAATTGSTTKASSKSEAPEGMPSDVREIERYKQMVAGGMQLTSAQARDFQGKVASLKSRLDRYKVAQTKMGKDGSGSDVAINSKGQVYLNGPGGITMKHMSQLTKEDGKYLMTLSQISQEVYNGEHPFNEDMLNTIENSVTSAAAMKNLRDEIKKMDYDSAKAESGSADMHITLEEYIKKNSLYKVSWNGIRDKRFKVQWKSLLDTMSEQDRNRLLLTGIIRNGYINGDEGSVFDAMYGVLKSDYDKSIVYDVGYNHFSSGSGRGSGKSGGKDDFDRSITTNTMALAMADAGSDLNGSSIEEFTFGNTSMKLHAYDPMHATDSGGNRYLSEGNLSNLTNGDSNKSNAYMEGSIYIGNKHLDETLTRTVAFFGRRMTYFPFMRDTHNKVVPDIEAQKMLDELQTKFGGTGITSGTALNKESIAKILGIAEKAGFNDKIRPKLIPEGMAGELISKGWNVGNLLENYFNIAYNEKMTNNKFFIAPADVATAIVPKSALSGLDVSTDDSKKNQGRQYAKPLDRMNFGLENDVQKSNRRQSYADYYNEVIINPKHSSAEERKKNLKKVDDLAVTTVVLPYRHYEDTGYMMDYVEQAEKYRTLFEFKKARGMQEEVEANKKVENSDFITVDG